MRGGGWEVHRRPGLTRARLTFPTDNKTGKVPRISPKSADYAPLAGRAGDFQGCLLVSIIVCLELIFAFFITSDHPRCPGI